MTPSTKVFKNTLIFNALLLSLLNIASAQYAQEPQNEPYPANPVGMQTYINKTKPNVAIAMDNSITMDTKIKRKLWHNQKSSERPRRIDVVKDAVLSIIHDYHDQFNFTYANITDYARDLHWKKLPTNPPTYDYSPHHGSGRMEDYNSRTTYNVLPVRGNKAAETLPRADKDKYRTPGTAHKAAKNLESSFANNYGRKYVGNVRIKEEMLPETAYKPSKSVKEKRMGNSLLVPYQDVYTTNYDSANHKAALDLAARTTGLRVSYLQYIYPNYVDYMASKIQYRCQDTYMLILTDGNTITNSYNRKAAQKYFSTNKTPNTKKNIGLRPKSSREKDGDGYYYNGPDFPEQNIRSYAIGIGTNASKFKRFENYGGGKAVTAIYAEDVQEIIEEFMQDMQPSNIFSMTSPTGSYLYTSSGQSILMANLQTDTKGWVGRLRFTKDISQSSASNDEDDDGDMTPKYEPNYAVYVASTNQGLIDLTSNTARSKLSRSDLNLAANINVDHYLKWITAYTKISTDIDEETKEIYDIYEGDTQDIFKGLRVRSVDGLSENRYLGDVLSSSLEMIGTINPKIKAPEYLTVGSNDGMFKVYKANPDYGKFLDEIKVPIYDEDDDRDEPKPIGYETIKVYDTAPYVYSFAYIPGTAQKENGINVLQSMALRAAPTYSAAPRPVHQYNINGEVAFRTTTKGHTFLVGTLGQGGKGAFALNVAGKDELTGKPIGLDTPKNQWANNVPLWDTSSTHFGHAATGSKALGYIMGKPVIGRIALHRQYRLPKLKDNVRYATVLPSGSYGDQKTEAGPTLYIYDALGVDVGVDPVQSAGRKPGQLIKKVTYALTPEQQRTFKYKNSLSEATLIDLDLDGVMDVGYVGDLNGNLYRLDLRGDTSNDWKLELIFEGDPTRPILNAPSISRFFQRSVIIFGTGSLARAETTQNRQQQVLYGLLENKDFTAHRDKPVKHNDSGLIEQTIKKGTNSATVSNHLVPARGFLGWKLPLGFGRDTGEALAQKPIIFNGTIFFQTYTYRDNQALPHEGLMCYRSLDASDTWLFQINALTGGALDENSTYLKQLGKTSAGKKNSGLIDKPVKLLEANTSPAISKDGEMLSGNDIDIALNSKASSNDNYDIADKHYINGDPCKALLSNGYEIVCPTEINKPDPEPDPDPDLPVQPQRISIINLY